MERLSINLPDIGEGVAQAEIVEWHVKIGDVVREDDLLAAVMTDKATVEIPSLYSGTVVELGGQIGEVIAVGASLAVIETDGAAIERNTADKPAAGALQEPEEQASATRSPVAISARPSPPTVNGVAPRPEGTAVLASPSVRARARDGGLDLRLIAGSGAAGRITHADLDEAFAAPLKSPPGMCGSSSGTRKSGSEQVKVVGLRRRIAERMAVANSRIPHITVIEEVDISALEDLREKLNSQRGDKAKLTLLPFICAALTKAFVEHPEMNAHFDDEAGLILRHHAVHLGIATMTEGGLVVPVLAHAEALNLFETAAEIARLSTAARSGKAERRELSGSTFTVTSLGPLGALATTPIINHPEVAILGINKMTIRPMWDGVQFQPRKVMNVSASFDHRVIDGWNAATFVQKLKSLLETPALIFVDVAA
jgi:2-oxoisovalerate dehydrogenase E2 component (dihydrolipoyl transacylase)